MVFQVEKALQDAGDKVSADEKSAVEADLNHLKDLVAKANPEVMSEGEVADLKASREKLMNSAQTLFAKMYEQAQGAQGAGGAGGAGPDMSGAQGQSYAGDDVVDGDYREV
jgi:molecular chaperone DnaK